MKWNIILAASLYACLSTAAEAHDRFLKLESFFLQPNGKAAIQLFNGTFTTSEKPVGREWMADVSVIDPSGATSAGREEMERLLSSLFAGAGRGSSHSSDIVGVHFVTDDVALADGEATIEGFTPSPAGGQTLRHRFTDVLVRGPEGWRIAQIRAYVFMRLPGP
jgi:ketosteroid isomerase-like protein